MPMYQYVCKKNGLRVEVIRHFSEYENVPTEEEVRSVIGADAEMPTEFEWEREIGGKQSLVRGENWRGMKGYW